MKVNIDRIAIGAKIRLGNTLCRKVSPMICAEVMPDGSNGPLIYDARLFDRYAQPPIVEYLHENRRPIRSNLV